MTELTIYLANKNYSSWSLRAWLALKQTGARFHEVVIPLDQPDTRARILEHSPSGRVPALKHGTVHVWESLAICEYLAEAFPSAWLWPGDPTPRAYARAISSEMHAGFVTLRKQLPMNLKYRKPQPERTENARADIERVTQLWREARTRFGDHGAHGQGPFLFGDFSNADAMFAPVATRFHSYEVKLDPVCQAYVDAIMAWPAMQEWIKGAKEESWVVPHDEVEHAA